MELHFLIPDPATFQSGGNRYNSALINALREMAIHVSHSPFDPNIFYGSPDTTYVLDSIYFAQITNPAQDLPPKCVALIHHLNSMYPGEAGYHERFEKAVLEHCSGCIATSAFTKEYLHSKGCPIKHVVTIEPAIAPRDALKSKTVTKVRALIVANCIPRKGILEFLQALAEVGAQPFFEINIIGSLEHDPVYAKRCQELILANPLLQKCVYLLGEQDDATLIRHYEKANLFLSTALFETFGMAIQEALIYRIPVLVHTGGHSGNHVVPGINGFAFDTHRTMAQLLSDYVANPGKLQKLHDAMRGYTPGYLNSWEAAAGILLDFLKLKQAG